MSYGIRLVMGGIVGAAFGYAWHRFVGCASGACPLSSNPWVSMSLWALVGMAMASS